MVMQSKDVCLISSALFGWNQNCGKYRWVLQISRGRPRVVSIVSSVGCTISWKVSQSSPPSL